MAEKYICLICKKTKPDSELLPTYEGKDSEGNTIQKNYKKILGGGVIINTHICCNHKMNLVLGYQGG